MSNVNRTTELRSLLLSAAAVANLDARIELRLAAPQQKRHCSTLVEFGDQRVDLVGAPGVDGRTLVDHRQNYIARLNVAAHAAADVFDEHAILDLELFLLLVGKVDKHQAHAVRLGFLLARRALARDAGRLLVLELGNGDGHVLRCAFAPHLHWDLGPRLDLGDDARKLRGGIDRPSVHLEDDVSGFDARLLRGAALFDRIDQRAGGLGEAERVGGFLAHFLDLHADAAAGDAALFLELLHRAHRDVDRYREGEPHVAAGATENERIDADDLAPHVEQRTAGVAG